MYVCNNIQEKETTQVYHNHIAVSSRVQLVSCVLLAPTPAKVTLAIHGKSLAEVAIPQRRLWQRRTGKKNKRSICNCDFQVCFCQSSIKKCLEKQNTVLRPWMLAEGFHYKECTTSLNKTNQPTTHSSPFLSQRLSLGNVTFSQEKKLLSHLLHSSPHIIHHWRLVVLYLPPPQNHNKVPQSLLNQLVSGTAPTRRRDSRILVLQALARQSTGLTWPN